MFQYSHATLQGWQFKCGSRRKSHMLVLSPNPILLYEGNNLSCMQWLKPIYYVLLLQCHTPPWSGEITCPAVPLPSLFILLRLPCSGVPYHLSPASPSPVPPRLPPCAQTFPYPPVATLFLPQPCCLKCHFPILNTLAKGGYWPPWTKCLLCSSVGGKPTLNRSEKRERERGTKVKITTKGFLYFW